MCTDNPAVVLAQAANKQNPTDTEGIERLTKRPRLVLLAPWPVIVCVIKAQGEDAVLMTGLLGAATLEEIERIAKKNGQVFAIVRMNLVISVVGRTVRVPKPFKKLIVIRDNKDIGFYLITIDTKKVAAFFI